jgi:hypothetical protein
VCAECGQPLSTDPPPPLTDPDIRLVEVYRAHGEVDAQMIRSILQANDVECMLSGESVRLTHAIMIDGLAEVKILVRDTDAARARDAIAASEHARLCTACRELNPAGATQCRYCGGELEPTAA